MTIPIDIRETMISAAIGTECPGCGRIMGEMVTNFRPTLDHILPRALGGTSTSDNLIAVCRGCNSRKSDQHPWDWTGDQHLVFQNAPPGKRSKKTRDKRRIAKAVACLLVGHERTEFERALSALFGYP